MQTGDVCSARISRESRISPWFIIAPSIAKYCDTYLLINSILFLHIATLLMLSAYQNAQDAKQLALKARFKSISSKSAISKISLTYKEDDTNAQISRFLNFLRVVAERSSVCTVAWGSVCASGGCCAAISSPRKALRRDSGRDNSPQQSFAAAKKTHYNRMSFDVRVPIAAISRFASPKLRSSKIVRAESPSHSATRFRRTWRELVIRRDVASFPVPSFSQRARSRAPTFDNRSFREPLSARPNPLRSLPRYRHLWKQSFE